MTRVPVTVIVSPLASGFVEVVAAGAAAEVARFPTFAGCLRSVTLAPEWPCGLQR